MPEWMTLEINGEPRPVPLLANVGELILFLGVGQDSIAVEVNRRIVRRADWDVTPLGNKDRVEIVQFVGGG
jgi:thiamine biosynthesis protein ThiS